MDVINDGCDHILPICPHVNLFNWPVVQWYTFDTEDLKREINIIYILSVIWTFLL